MAWYGSTDWLMSQSLFPPGTHVITAADPLPGELRQAIEAINDSR
jgi:hypothetical protein